MKTAVRFYRKYLTRFTPNCPMEPSCSAYGLQALSLHGNTLGTGMLVYRIISCNPWNHRKHDPISHTLGREEKRRALPGWLLIGFYLFLGSLGFWL